jgi:hypothetical protein
MQALKQAVARRLLRKSAQPSLWEPLQHFWQRRFYDFNVWSAHKWREKLNYMHDNPVRRGLVPSPELWAWSSYRAYACGQPGVVKLNDWPKPEFVAREDPNSRVPGTHPAKTAQGGAPPVSYRPKEEKVGHPPKRVVIRVAVFVQRLRIGDVSVR